jgi:hypothetical protein
MVPMVWFVLFFVFLCSRAFATDYYVDNSIGSDGNPGTSEALPFANYYRAVDVINAGGGSHPITVYIKSNGGEYTVRSTGVSITRSGIAGSPITFRNYPGHAPSLKCATVPTTGSSCISFILETAPTPLSYISIIGLTIHQANYAVKWNGADHVVVRDNHFYDTASSSIQGRCADCTIDRNHMHGAGDCATCTTANVNSLIQYSIYYAGQGGIITNNVMYNNTGYCIQMQGEPVTATYPNVRHSGVQAFVFNNTCGYSNNSAGFVLTVNTGGGSANYTGTRIENNLLVHNCFTPLAVSSTRCTTDLGAFTTGGAAVRSAIQVSDLPLSSGAVIRNNVSYDTDNLSGSSFVYCVRSGVGIWNETVCNTNGVINTSGGNTKTTNPNLANAPSSSLPASPDFHLTSSSLAAIGTGRNLTTDFTTLNISRVDKDGVARAASGGWSVGAYEPSGGGGDTTPPAPPTGVTITRVIDAAREDAWL